METVDGGELLHYARIPLQLNVKPGESVLILADTRTEEVIPKALAAAARELGAEPAVMVMEARSAPNEEPPRMAVGALKSADVVLLTASYPILHTDGMREALATGLRYVGMVGITVDLMTRGAATEDPKRLFEVTKRAASLLTEASTARVTSREGTDVTMDLRGRRGLILGGVCIPGEALGGFPHGEAPIAPVEGSVEGTIVIDTTLDPFGRVSEPVVLRVERGRITGIEGGAEAEKLRDLLASKQDDNCYMIAEFSLGTNSRARITGNSYEDRRKLGTVHFGFGDNASLGGNVRARIHLDGIILRPTVALDGRTVLENGVPGPDLYPEA